jgi:hypothetical protein
MPLIQEADNHQDDDQAECDDVKCMMCLEQKKLDCSKESAGFSKVKSQPDKRDVMEQVNLPPYRPHPDASAQLDQINFFGAGGYRLFFPKWQL